MRFFGKTPTIVAFKEAIDITALTGNIVPEAAVAGLSHLFAYGFMRRASKNFSTL